MSFKEFNSSVTIGSLQVDTVIERPNLEEGESLNGTIYLEDAESDREIDWIELKVLKVIQDGREGGESLETVIGKQTLEFAGAVKSKDSVMSQFELVPDERWLAEHENTTLVLRTIVHLVNGEQAEAEDSFTYTAYEN